MTEEGKKISFGFAKTIKKPLLKNTVQQEEKKVDYIECLDNKGIKVIGEEEKKDEPLVIPLLGTKTWHDRIINKIDADIFEPKPILDKEEKEEIKVKQEPGSEVTNGNATPILTDIPPVVIKTEPVDPNTSETTLEEQAAKEIIEDLQSTDKKEKPKVLTLPVTEDPSLRGEEESTIEDYERIPIDAFGLAMLRGMGWQPGRGIGKNEKIVPAVIPELRPKGMGLGADKVTMQKKTTESKEKPQEEIKIEKGTCVKIISGKHNNSYGQIEGLDDDVGRLIVKLALGGNIISVNEFMVQAVTKAEYNKKAKVLNAVKYEEYKNKQSVDSKRSPSSESSKSSQDSEEEQNAKDKRGNTERHSREKEKRLNDKKKSKKRERHSSESDVSIERKSRKRRSSSSSSRQKTKKSKKSKKHKKRDNSPEQSNKKRKKKDKEREKAKDKRNRDYETLDRRKHSKQKKSRSRSPKRRSRSRSRSRSNRR